MDIYNPRISFEQCVEKYEQKAQSFVSFFLFFFLRGVGRSNGITEEINGITEEIKLINQSNVLA